MTTVIGMGRRQAAISMRMLDQLARQEAQRETMNEQMREARDAADQQTIGQFTGMGAAYDMERYGDYKKAVNAQNATLSPAEAATMDQAAEQSAGAFQPIVDPSTNPEAYNAAGEFIGGEALAAEGAQAVGGEVAGQAVGEAAVQAGGAEVAGGAAGQVVAGESAAALGGSTVAGSGGGTAAGAVAGAAPAAAGGASGTAAGAEVGSSFGPWGTAIGAAIGLIATQLF